MAAFTQALSRGTDARASDLARRPPLLTLVLRLGTLELGVEVLDGPDAALQQELRVLVIRGLETVLQAVELGFGGEASREKLVHPGPSLFSRTKSIQEREGKRSRVRFSPCRT